MTRLLTAYPEQRERLLGWLELTPKQFEARELSGRLTPVESDRAYRLARILELATDLHSGDSAAGVQWLLAPARSFRGETPLERARTEAGARHVEDLIGRLQHGVFT